MPVRQHSQQSRGSHKKKVKKLHNKCDLSPKMENPPKKNKQAQNKQIMKSFHLSGPKFDIAVEMFCMVEFSIRSEICRGQIRIFY